MEMVLKIVQRGSRLVQGENEVGRAMVGPGHAWQTGGAVPCWNRPCRCWVGQRAGLACQAALGLGSSAQFSSLNSCQQTMNITSSSLSVD